MAGYATAQSAALKIRQADNASLPHDDYGRQFLATIWTLTGLATIFLALRLYCKRLRHKKLWWDDYVLIASWICLIVQTSLLTALVPMGFAKHSWEVKDWPSYLMVANVTGVFSIVAAAWSKTSFAITLLRISDGWMRHVVWFVIVTVNVTLGLSALFTYVQCTPIEKVWNSDAPGSCWPGYIVVIYNSFSSAWSGAMDMLLATLPWRIIRSHSLSKHERLGVSIAMSMGVFAGMTSIAKVVTLHAIKDPDPIVGVPMMCLATAEIAVTIIAASIPVLRALLKQNGSVQLSPRFYRSYHSRTQSGATVPRNMPIRRQNSGHSQPSASSVHKDTRFLLGSSSDAASVQDPRMLRDGHFALVQMSPVSSHRTQSPTYENRVRIHDSIGPIPPEKDTADRRI